MNFKYSISIFELDLTFYLYLKQLVDKKTSDTKENRRDYLLSLHICFLHPNLLISSTLQNASRLPDHFDVSSTHLLDKFCSLSGIYIEVGMSRILHQKSNFVR